MPNYQQPFLFWEGYTYGVIPMLFVYMLTASIVIIAVCIATLKYKKQNRVSLISINFSRKYLFCTVIVIIVSILYSFISDYWNVSNPIVTEGAEKYFNVEIFLFIVLTVSILYTKVFLKKNYKVVMTRLIKSFSVLMIVSLVFYIAYNTPQLLLWNGIFIIFMIVMGSVVYSIDFNEDSFCNQMIGSRYAPIENYDDLFSTNKLVADKIKTIITSHNGNISVCISGVWADCPKTSISIV